MATMLLRMTWYLHTNGTQCAKSWPGVKTVIQTDFINLLGSTCHKRWELHNTIHSTCNDTITTNEPLFPSNSAPNSPQYQETVHTLSIFFKPSRCVSHRRGHNIVKTHLWIPEGIWFNLGTRWWWVGSLKAVLLYPWYRTTRKATWAPETVWTFRRK
jgi:hypothetical protein